MSIFGLIKFKLNNERFRYNDNIDIYVSEEIEVNAKYWFYFSSDMIVGKINL